MRPFFRHLAILTLAVQAGLAAQNLGQGTENYPPAYVGFIREAMRAFAARDFEAAIKMVDKADLAFQVTPMALNVRGAIAIEEKKFDEGRAFCLKALQNDPNYYPARFNLCEIPFIQGKYEEARALYRSMRETYPDDDLLKFRVFLTYLLEKNEAAAKQLLDGVPEVGRSPLYYYTQAAWSFAHDDPAAGKKWLQSGFDIFPAPKHLNFVDVFYDLKWIERPEAPKPDE